MNPGKLYLIPTPLGDTEPAETLPQSVLETACGLRCFVVEELRTARRFLSRYGLRGHIDELDFHVLNEHTSPAEVEALLPLFNGRDVGLMSEAGLPAVADPGAALVALCHRHGIEVVPLVGPSSLMMALMASGLNGQSFAFRGYIPAKTDERRAALKELEKQSRTLNQSQIFIETPYRNDALFADMLQTLSPSTQLCVAADITLPTQFIATKTIAQWRKEIPGQARNDDRAGSGSSFAGSASSFAGSTGESDDRWATPPDPPRRFAPTPPRHSPAPSRHSPAPTGESIGKRPCVFILLA